MLEDRCESSQPWPPYMRENMLQFELPDYLRFSFDGYDFDEADLGKLIFINNMKIVSASGFSIRIGFYSMHCYSLQIVGC